MQKISARPIQSMFVVAALAVSLVAVLVMSGAQSRSVRGEVLLDPAAGAIVFPRVQIIQWQDSAGRFDSTNGEIKRFHGDPRNPSVRPQWVPDVPAVRERTSGMLRIEHPVGPSAVDMPFLVDVVSGQTWLLQRRPTGANWERVETVR